MTEDGDDNKDTHKSPEDPLLINYRYRYLGMPRRDFERLPQHLHRLFWLSNRLECGSGASRGWYVADKIVNGIMHGHLHGTMHMVYRFGIRPTCLKSQAQFWHPELQQNIAFVCIELKPCSNRPDSVPPP